jgi:hypothetical protein
MSYMEKLATAYGEMDKEATVSTKVLGAAVEKGKRLAGRARAREIFGPMARSAERAKKIRGAKEYVKGKAQAAKGAIGRLARRVGAATGFTGGAARRLSALKQRARTGGGAVKDVRKAKAGQESLAEFKKGKTYRRMMARRAATVGGGAALAGGGAYAATRK